MTDIPSIKKNHKIEQVYRLIFIDQLKGLAIIGIVLYHWFNYMTVGPVQKAFVLGGQGVHIFFILSGFGLTFSVLKNVDHNWSAWFYKRIKKILAPYYLAVFFVLALVVIYGVIVDNVDQTFKRMAVNIKDIAATLFLYRNFENQFILSINSAWWFIPTIFELYLIFPILYRLYQRLSPVKFLGLVLIVNVLYQAFCLKFVKYGDPVTSRFCLSFIFEFSLGICFANWYLKDPVKCEDFLSNKKVLLFGVLLEAFGILLTLKGGELGKLVTHPIDATGIFIICFNVVSLLRNSRLLTFLGENSLGIFLIHQTFIQLIFQPWRDLSVFILLSCLLAYLTLLSVLVWLFNRVQNPMPGHSLVK